MSDDSPGLAVAVNIIMSIIHFIKTPNPRKDWTADALSTFIPELSV
jgi:hypothetical protein